MRIYVDELPKDCWDCPMHDGENGQCKMLVCYTDYIPKNCPLQSLADYTKQVRKEVCNDFKSRFLATCQIEKGCNTASFSLEVLNRILDQLQGENK